MCLAKLQYFSFLTYVYLTLVLGAVLYPCDWVSDQISLVRVSSIRLFNAVYRLIFVGYAILLVWYVLKETVQLKCAEIYVLSDNVSDCLLRED